MTADTLTADSLTAPFWAAAAERRLVRQVCDVCRRSTFTPRIACPHCQSEALGWTQSSGLGTVHSHSVVHRSPTGDRETPYVVAIIDLDEGWDMMSNVVGCPPEDVVIGMPVQVTFAERDGRLAPVFTPRTADASPQGDTR